MSVYLSPEELKPHPKNAEIYEDRDDSYFERSILENGMLEPLVVTSQNVVLRVYGFSCKHPLLCFIEASLSLKSLNQI